MQRPLLTAVPVLLFCIISGAAISGNITSDTLSNDAVLPALKQALDGKAGLQNSAKVNSVVGIYQEGKSATIYSGSSEGSEP
jgi:hypothetical protein